MLILNFRVFYPIYTILNYDKRTSEWKFITYGHFPFGSCDSSRVIHSPSEQHGQPTSKIKHIIAIRHVSYNYYQDKY
jgi:hypothetical protein